MTSVRNVIQVDIPALTELGKEKSVVATSDSEKYSVFICIFPSLIFEISKKTDWK